MLFRRAYPELKRIDVVDIDPCVFDMARKHFGYRDDDGVIASHVCDGRLFLRNTERKYDAIILDAYSAGGRIPWHLVTDGFMGPVKERLAPGGVMLMNVISAIEGSHSRLLQAVHRTATGVFPSAYLFPRYRMSEGFGPTTTSNMFIVATLDTERHEPAAVLERYRARLGGAVRMDHLLDPVVACRSSIAYAPGTPILTDDYAPTDSMTFR